MEPGQIREHLTDERDRLTNSRAGDLERIDAELDDVEHALKRLDDGTYGTCETCGQPVGDERLAAMPAARFCVVDDEAPPG